MPFNSCLVLSPKYFRGLPHMAQLHNVVVSRLLVLARSLYSSEREKHDLLNSAVALRIPLWIPTFFRSCLLYGWDILNPLFGIHEHRIFMNLEPLEGIKPPTFGLQNRCSISWATVAYKQSTTPDSPFGIHNSVYSNIRCGTAKITGVRTGAVPWPSIYRHLSIRYDFYFGYFNDTDTWVTHGINAINFLGYDWFWQPILSLDDDISIAGT